MSGHGLALCGVVVEQDAAYWEVHIDVSAGNEQSSYDIMAGVASKKDRSFYASLDGNGGKNNQDRSAKSAGWQSTSNPSNMINN